MKKVLTCFAISLVLSLPVQARERIYMQFDIFQNGQKLDTGSDVISTKKDAWKKGLLRSYLKLTCQTTSDGRVIKNLSTVDLFDGLEISHQIIGGKVELNVSHATVRPVITEIRALARNECRNLAPEVTSQSGAYSIEYKAAGEYAFEFNKDMRIVFSLQRLGN